MPPALPQDLQKRKGCLQEPACGLAAVSPKTGGAFYGAVRSLPTYWSFLRGQSSVAFAEWVYVCAYAHSILAGGVIAFGRFALVGPLLAQFDSPYSWSSVTLRARQFFCASLLRAAYRWGGIAAARHPRSRASREYGIQGLRLALGKVHLTSWRISSYMRQRWHP